jgi:hypothetical protein
MPDDMTFEFLVAAPSELAPKELDVEDDLAQHVSLPAILRRSNKVEISGPQLAGFWKDKVVGLTDTLAEAQAAHATKGFAVDEIAFSLGVGAKGGIFFVAEGSIDASITVTLRRRA